LSYHNIPNKYPPKLNRSSRWHSFK